MKGFLGILKGIGQVGLGVAAIVYPQLGPLFQRLQSTIIAVEQTHSDGQGVLKSEAVKADFIEGLATTQEFMAMAGKVLSWDEDLLKAAIDAQVLAYNKMAALKASFKVVDK